MRGDALIGSVARMLAQLPWKVVYVGGSTTFLHLTDRSAPEPELTDDVDVVVEVTSPVEYQVALRTKLRALGAREDTSEGAPLCRWLLAGLTVDVMTPNDQVLGFSNRWYPLALETSEAYRLSDGTEIQLIASTVFVATKLDAYGNRGNGDCLASKDIEDVIAVLDGRPEFVEELSRSTPALRDYVGAQFEALLRHVDFRYAVEGYMREAPERAAMVVARMQRLLAVRSASPE